MGKVLLFDLWTQPIMKPIRYLHGVLAHEKNTLGIFKKYFHSEILEKYMLLINNANHKVYHYRRIISIPGPRTSLHIYRYLWFLLSGLSMYEF